jgi:hypothetical protein
MDFHFFVLLGIEMKYIISGHPYEHQKIAEGSSGECGDTDKYLGIFTRRT